MNPPPAPDPQPPKRPLPPELAFLKYRPEVKDMEPEEVIEFNLGLIALIRLHAARILEYGLDPDKLLALIEPNTLALVATQKKYEAAEDHRLDLMIKSADAQRDLFKAFEALVLPAYKISPFDPEIQEAKEYLDAWREHMPKDI